MNLNWNTDPKHENVTFVTRDDGRDFCEVWNRGGTFPFKVYWITAYTINGEDTYRTLDDVRAAIAEAVTLEESTPSLPTPAPEETDHTFSVYDTLGPDTKLVVSQCSWQIAQDIKNESPSTRYIIQHGAYCSTCDRRTTNGRETCDACIAEDKYLRERERAATDAIINNASRIVSRLRLTSLGIATGALFALTLAHASASPASCTSAGTTGEGFPVVRCADGSRWYQDLDGNALPGLAYRAPGTWVAQS